MGDEEFEMMINRDSMIVEVWHGGQIVWLSLDRKTAILFPIQEKK